MDRPTTISIILIAVIAIGVLLTGCQYGPFGSLPACEEGIVKQDVGQQQTASDQEAAAADSGDTMSDQDTMAAEEESMAETEPAEEETSRDGVPVKTVTAGELVSFPNLRAVDPDGDPITYTFTDPLNESGMWQTSEDDVGEYKIVITASDGEATAEQEVIIKVISDNSAPTISLDDVQVEEGDTIELDPEVSDPDGDEVSVVYSGWMDSSTKETTFGDAGTHEVIVTASDGRLETSKTITITVGDVNRAPEFAPIGDIALQEGDRLQLTPQVTDPDGDEVTLTYTSPLGEDGVWQTERGDAGTYRINITATDSEGATTVKTILLAVEDVNTAPEIIGPEALSFEEGDTIDLGEHYTVEDEDDQDVSLQVSGWMDSLVRETDFSDQGDHEVVLTADDGSNDPVSRTITISVGDVNRAPVFTEGSFE